VLVEAPFGQWHAHMAKHLDRLAPSLRRGPPGRWRRIPSTICAPIVNAGFSDVIGSWKIIEMRSPRMSRRRDGGKRRVRALEEILARATRPGSRRAP
jgi:hypothetical protein